MLLLLGGVVDRERERRLDEKILFLRVGGDLEPLEVDLDLSKGILNYKTDRNWLYIYWRVEN